ncbi:MAG: hypothetical protein EHM61_20905 [Acidobacteria bacterium]|nr:MAG: hypothetical protein EHM61_20905 [Acidobacteriota bacterium]
MIHSGTVISVRTIDNIDVDAAQAGATFSASIDQPIVDGDRVVVSKGSEATLRALKVEQSGKMKGKDLIQLELTSIVVKGKRYQVATSFQEIAGKSEGKSTRRKILGGAGAGAVVGAIAGGGKGAAIGAAIGGSAGTAISASGEQHLKVPSETRLEFRLDNDLTIQEQVARAE